MAKKRRRWAPNSTGERPELILPPDPRFFRATDLLLKRYHERFDHGDKLALLDAVDLCGRAGLLPLWVRNAFADAWPAYRTYQAPTLDQAFGVERPTGGHFDKRRERERLRALILFRVYSLHYQEAAPFDMGTFARVAKEIKKSPSYVLDIFSEAESDALRELLRNWPVSEYSETD
jgi:AraC-like DNA-binding protein